ncbi:MAG: transglycosylase SLT domain-containing protein [Firmicutes bacterium]|nr:transglycosylase SLT domain-containing protein [Bacillota bacterium]
MTTDGKAKHDQYDELIKRYAEAYDLDWELIKRQMLAESEANPRAVSSHGAKGLMQFMPAAWREWGEGDPFNPEASIKAGVAYMTFLLGRFAEIPDLRERHKFALASYNAGRTNINLCLEYARQATGAPGRFQDWVDAGKPPGPWQTWRVASQFLSMVTGRHAAITRQYVDQIMGEELE